MSYKKSNIVNKYMSDVVNKLVRRIKDSIPRDDIVYIVLDYKYPGMIRVFDNKNGATSYFNELRKCSSGIILIERKVEEGVKN
jgi:hypothetical protein